MSSAVREPAPSRADGIVRARPSALTAAIEAVTGATDRGEAIRALVQLQHDLVDARAAVALAVEDGQVFEVARITATDPPWLASARRSIAMDGTWTGTRRLEVPGPGADSQRELLAVSVPGSGDDRLVVLLETEARDALATAVARERLELSAPLLRAAELARLAPVPLREVLELAIAAGSGETPEAAATGLVEGLARIAAAGRVALGLRVGSRMHLLALSGTGRIDRGAATVRALEDMLRQVDSWEFDPCLSAGEGEVLEGTGVSLTDSEGRSGVLWVEAAPGPRDAKSEHERRIEGLLRLVSDVAGRMLLRDLEQMLPLGPRVGHSILRRARRLGSPRQTRSMLAWVAGAIAAVLLLIPFPDGVTAPCVVLAPERRVISAPFDGRISSAPVLPGQQVRGGESVLFELDIEDIELERSRALAEVAQAEHEASLARREGDPGREQIALHAAARARSTRELAEHRMREARVLAPVDGIVLEGDLRQRLGAPVARGEALLEVAPLDDLGAEVFVPESRILEIAIGRTGSLRSAARPGQAIPLRVERVDPVAMVREGANVFRVRVSLASEAGSEAAQALLPGMAGVAVIDAGARPRIVSWSTRLWKALRLRWWI